MAPTAGMLRYNTDNKYQERSTDNGGTWTQLDLSGANLQIAQSTTLTGTQNNFTVSAGRHVIFDCLNASLLTITGISKADKLNGDIVEFLCTNTIQVNFTHQSGSSSAGNKLVNFVSSCVTSITGAAGTAQGGYVRYVYRSSVSAWVLTNHEQGGYIEDLSRTTSTPAGGGTVSTSLSINRYKLQGKTLIWHVYVAWTPTGTVSGVELTGPVANIAFPTANLPTILQGTSSNTFAFAMGRVSGGGNTTMLFLLVNIGGSVINFGSGANAFLGTIIVEVT